MGVFSNKFEKKWLAIFLGLYVFIMLPFPWQYNESYVPGFGGVPCFIFAWLGHGFITLLAIIIYSRQCLSRKEYLDFEKIQPVYRQEENNIR